MGDKVPNELRLKSKQLESRLDQVHTAIQEGKSDLVPRPVKAVVWGCFAIGVVLIASTVLKTWLGTPNPLDWGLLFVGFLLCVFSLLKKFRVGKEGVEGEVSDVLRVLSDAKQLMANLFQ